MERSEQSRSQDVEQQFGEQAARAFAEASTENVLNMWMEREMPADMTGMTVLDFGCGSGRRFSSFKRRKARRIIGIDASRAMLAELRGHEIFGTDALAKASHIWDLELILIHGWAHEILPALPLKVDFVLASFSLCVMDDPKEALSAIHAVLSPGGRVLISTNVIVPQEDAPTSRGSVCEVKWNREPTIATRGPDGRPKDLLSILHFSEVAVPVVDKAHALRDYTVDPKDWTIERAALIKQTDCTTVDGKDRLLQEQYYGRVMGNAFSLLDASAERPCLCMKLQRR